MKPGTTLLMLVAAVLALTVSMTAPAQAQATRTWVSGVGDDANPCSRTAPCKTFAGAISKTAAHGQIDCLDPGGFGAVTITKSITIFCEEETGHVIVAGTNAITVNAGTTDIVTLRGLDLDGVTGSGSLSGINFLAGGALHVEEVVIRGFDGASAGFGINIAPSTNASIYITDTIVSGNGNTGAATGGNINIKPSGNVAVNVTLKRVEMSGGAFGLKADGSTASALRVSVNDSVASGNGFNGFAALAPTGNVAMMLRDATSSHNGTNGVRGDGINATVAIGHSVISGNATGVSIANSANVVSYKDNQINLNTANGTPVPAVSPN